MSGVEGAGGDDDAWLYGEEGEEDPTPTDKAEETTEGEGMEKDNEIEEQMESEENAHIGENGDSNIVEGHDGNEGNDTEENTENEPPAQSPEEDDSEEDDDVEITIDKDKIDAAKTSYQNLQLKKGATEYSGQKEKKGKFVVEEFDQIGTINGETAVDFDLESLEEKPWRKPGADITDYFNYGFTEDTWTAYCNRQKQLRVNEAGVSVMGNSSIVSANRYTGGVSSGISSIPTLGGDPTITPKPTILSSTLNTTTKPDAPSGITVMTHEKRVYSNKIIGGMDFSVPPPAFSLPPPGLPPPVLGVEAGIPVSTDYPPPDPFGEGDPYAGGYEPTAEAQWSLPPPSWDQSQPPPIDPYGQDRSYRRRDSRPDDRYRDYDRDRRVRRRTRSRSPKDRDRREKEPRERERDRGDRERGDRERSDRERGDRERGDRERVDRERGDRDRERRIKKEKRSRTRSPRHKKSRRDRREKREGDPDTPEDGNLNIKDEPQEKVDKVVAPTEQE